MIVKRDHAVLAIAAVACVIPLGASHYLPAVDLPQHTAQIALWVHQDDPAFFPPGMYRFNWFTPYLGAYVVARVLAAVFGVVLAVKATVAIAVLAVPTSAWVLLRTSGADGRWAWAGVPLAFGVSFYSGFLNFLLAIPVVVLLVAAAIRYGESRGTRGGALVALASFGLALCHALAFGVGAVVATAGLWGSARDRRTRLRGTVLTLAPLPLVVLWATSVWLREEHVRTAMHWAGLPSRVFRAPASVVGSPHAGAGWAALGGLAIVLGVLGVRLREHRGVRWALVAAGAFFLVAPDALFRTVAVPERFVAVVAILSLALLRMPDSVRARRAVILVLACSACAWSAHLAFRFRAFDREMSGFEQVLERTESGRVLRMIPIDAYSRAVPGYPLFWNVGAWYQIEKRGFVGFSFAQTFPALIRYRVTPPWAEAVGASRGELNWSAGDREVDYFLFRSESVDPTNQFPQGPDRSRSLARAGEWRLYGKPPRP